MKKFLMILFSFLMVLSFSGMAGATPIDYEIDAANSNVILSSNQTSNWTGEASISGALVSGLGSTSGEVLDGETDAIDFFTLTVDNSSFYTGIDDYDISATLAFLLPDVGPAQGSGSGIYGAFLGHIRGGTLSWDSTTLPVVLTTQSGNRLSVDFQSGFALGCGDMVTVHAYLTNLGQDVNVDPASVPEPATLFLLGAGMIGIFGASRKGIFKK